MRQLALILSITLALLSAPKVFGAHPSWYPKTSCRQAWSNQDKAKYDYKKDGSYQTYMQRLARAGTASRANCYKDWTVLVYMAADNDLNTYALWDLREMEGGFASGNYAASTLKSDLIVEADTSGRTGVRRLHMFQTPDAYLAARSKDEFATSSIEDVQSPVVSIRKEPRAQTGADHKKNLEAFLDWGMRAYPAEHYMVIVWGHGQGWAADASTKADDIFSGRFGGMAFGDDPSDYLSIPALSTALANVKARTLENQRGIDVYASDACLMQMTEVAYEISQTARYIVGSSQVQSFLGLPYRQMMYEINSGRFASSGGLVGRGDEPFLVAKMLPPLALAALDPVRGQQGRADKESAKQFTMSALSSDALNSQLAPAAQYLGARLLAYLQEDPLRAGDLRVLIKKTPNFMGGSRDLGSFAGLIRLHLEEEFQATGTQTRAERALLEASDLVRGSLQLTALSSSFGARYQSANDPLHILGFKAVGIWLPQSPQEFEARIADFEQSRFFGAGATAPTSWEKWLRALYPVSL